MLPQAANLDRLRDRRPHGIASRLSSASGDLTGRLCAKVAAGDQAVLAEWPQLPLNEQARNQHQRFEERVVSNGVFFGEPVVGPAVMIPPQ
ncbi:hypothetical protein Shyd_86210 [Streptomyces hydrogenans]|uniref:Uncharacterized protein n=1 Tax=Streptomyces hydrogenans TaxID=1873719 RepID=A0ABQ3PQF9_9ACTN|nr:hypothetical protein GCM10018784_74280 [Streptomyces hydrogenans]GHI27250.1 hypothetical protein Shyd_86210 [Streptomyces hydrogenans]